MSELHWMRWKAFPGISNSFSIPGNEWTTLNEMESISRYIILIFYTWKWVNYTEWDGEHFQVYHSHFLYLEMSELHWMRWRAFPGISFSFSIPGNEWTTLNEMESISRYIILIFYTWKWVNYTEWDGEHFQVYLTHFLYLEMSELHWMRWRAFPGIYTMRSFSHFLYLEMSELHWMRWKAFPGISNSFSIPGNEWTTLNEMESISRYIILIFYTWKWVNYTEWDGEHFQVYHSHFLYLEMSELHWMRWRAFPGISFSFSIPGNEWTTLNEMESISRYIFLIFYTWKWVNYTEWDGKHFQVYHSHFLSPGNEWTTLNEMESISRYIILIFYTWKWVNYTEWDGEHFQVYHSHFLYLEMSELHWMRWTVHFQVYHSHFLYLEMSELHWMRWRAFPGISFSFSIPGNEWTTLNEMESISRYIITHFLYLEMSELHWMRWRAFPGISFSFSIPGNEWTTLNEMESISRYIHSHFLYLEMSELHWMRWRAFPGIFLIFYTWKWVNYTEWDGKHFQVYLFSFSIPGNEWTTLNEMESISRYIILIFYTWKWVNYTEWDGEHFQVYHSHFLYLEMSELHWMRWRAFPGISIFIFYTWKWVNCTEWDGKHFQVYH